MRPGCKMLARVSFLAANFLSRDWHFPPHSHPAGSAFRAGRWPLGTQSHTHTLGRLSLAALITLLLLDVASGIPEVIPKQRSFWCNERAAPVIAAEAPDPLPPGPLGPDGSWTRNLQRKLSPEPAWNPCWDPCPRPFPSLVLVPRASPLPPRSLDARTGRAGHRVPFPQLAGSLTPSFGPNPLSVPSMSLLSCPPARVPCIP